MKLVSLAIIALLTVGDVLLLIHIRRTDYAQRKAVMAFSDAMFRQLVAQGEKMSPGTELVPYVPPTLPGPYARTHEGPHIQGGYGPKGPCPDTT